MSRPCKHPKTGIYQLRKAVPDDLRKIVGNGRRFRVLNIVDDVTKECLGAVPDTSISARRVARELTMIVERRGKPGSIVSETLTAAG